MPFRFYPDGAAGRVLLVRACIIFNPAARGEKARRNLARLQECARSARLLPTTGPGTARSLAAAAATEGFDTIIAAGGDGTINEVINGLADTPHGMASCHLGVLPSGTANVLACELGLPRDVRRAFELIQQGQTRSLDLLEASFQTVAGPTRRLAIQLAGAGLDARATELVDWQWKKRVGFLAYASACFRALREARSRLEAHANGERLSAELVLIGNGQCYGGPFPVFSGAQPDDGLMDLCLFPRVHYGTALTCVGSALTNGWKRWRAVRRIQTDQLQLTSERRTPLELDGEPVGFLPATLTVRRQAIRVLVPLA